MPAKKVKIAGRPQKVWIKSILLPNGNLLIPKRIPEYRSIADWVEVEPGTSDYKRWLPVATNEPDPRQTEEYKMWRAKVDQIIKEENEA